MPAVGQVEHRPQARAAHAPTSDIVAAAEKAKRAGATRFCMGAAWREPNDQQVEEVSHAVREVGALGLETCATLGMLTAEQANTLADAGLDYYNHNLDTSPEFYGEIITTRVYQDRLTTLAHVRDSGVKLCTGGIVGMGESRRDRAGLLAQLAQLDPHPESVPINLLVQVPGTPLFGTEKLDPLELVRTIAAATADDAGIGGSAVSRSQRDDRRAPSPVPTRRGQQHLPRRSAPHHRQSRRHPRRGRCWRSSTSELVEL